jgi:hypothetical protein
MGTHKIEARLCIDTPPPSSIKPPHFCSPDPSEVIENELRVKVVNYLDSMKI